MNDYIDTKDQAVKDGLKQAVLRLTNKYAASHLILFILNTLIFVASLVLAVIVNDVSQNQRTNIDENFAQVLDNSNFMQPFLILLVIMSSMLIFALVRSNIFTSKLMPEKVIDKIRAQGCHGIIFPLLYELFYLFFDDIMKSCSAEIIVTGITIMMIFTFLQILYTLQVIMLENSSYAHNIGLIKSNKKDAILNMLQCIYDRQKEENHK